MQISGISDLDFSDDEFEDISRRENLRMSFQHLESITDKWGYFRQIYMERIPEILSASKQNIHIGIDPYFIDWMSFFSPIESDAWNIIRSSGKIVMYPQFPLFNYFIDFANPFLRIGLELDGKSYHDPVKDKVRDEKLAKYGWKIFRVSSKECNVDFKIPSELTDDHDIISETSNWILNTCHGVVYALTEYYFTEPSERNPDHLNLIEQTLHAHKGADFDL